MSTRPQNCRNRLRDEGKPYPKSRCEHCKTGGLTGCPFERTTETPCAADISQAERDVLAERRRQIDVEGWTPKHDDSRYREGVLIRAAKAYFLYALGRAVSHSSGELAGIPEVWPWSAMWWKPKFPRRDMVRAGALVLAERDLIKRKHGELIYPHHADVEAYYRWIITEIERLDRATATGATAKLTVDWTVSDSTTARAILNHLGIGDDASLEPGADRRRDKVAAIICAAREHDASAVGREEFRAAAKKLASEVGFLSIEDLDAILPASKGGEHHG